MFEGGVRDRNRTCLIGNVSQCLNVTGGMLPNETGICNTMICPNWHEWKEWSECPHTCVEDAENPPSQSRWRTCKGNMADCIARDIWDSSGENQVRLCNTEECPAWLDWSEWTTCTVTCGGGIRQRERECGFGNSTQDCIDVYGGFPFELDYCSTNDCDEWQEWTEWTECSQSCGGGVRNRTRVCGMENTTMCAITYGGASAEFETCMTHECVEGIKNSNLILAH